jgi:hypothetical protein
MLAETDEGLVIQLERHLLLIFPQDIAQQGRSLSCVQIVHAANSFQIQLLGLQELTGVFQHQLSFRHTSASVSQVVRISGLFLDFSNPKWLDCVPRNRDVVIHV